MQFRLFAKSGIFPTLIMQKSYSLQLVLKNHFPAVGNKKCVDLDTRDYVDFWAQHTG